MSQWQQLALVDQVELAVGGCVSNTATVLARFGLRVGAIGTQTTLPFGTPDEVRRVVRERIETVGKGGGLVLGPTHAIEPEVPLENIIAFIEAAKEYGKY